MKCQSARVHRPARKRDPADPAVVGQWPNWPSLGEFGVDAIAPAAWALHARRHGQWPKNQVFHKLKGQE